MTSLIGEWYELVSRFVVDGNICIEHQKGTHKASSIKVKLHNKHKEAVCVLESLEDEKEMDIGGGVMANNAFEKKIIFFSFFPFSP